MLCPSVAFIRYQFPLASLCPSVRPSVRPCVCVCVCLFVCLSVYLSSCAISEQTTEAIAAEFGKHNRLEAPWAGREFESEKLTSQGSIVVGVCIKTMRFNSTCQVAQRTRDSEGYTIFDRLSSLHFCLMAPYSSRYYSLQSTQLHFFTTFTPALKKPTGVVFCSPKLNSDVVW